MVQYMRVSSPVALTAAAAAAAAAACADPLRPAAPPAVGWHQLKHGSKAVRGSRQEKRSLGDLIRVHCQVGSG